MSATDDLKEIQQHQRHPFPWKYRGIPMVIAVDFDGTCVESNWPEKPVSKPGAVATIQYLLNQGHTIIIWTCRNNEQPDKFGQYAGIGAVRKWIADNFCPPGWPYPHPNILLNESALSSLDLIGETRKVFAHVYIDDRNLGGFPGWDKVLPMLGIGNEE
jgi:hydroxymethylpyrimidine pyrophosphatase-like HAD family hydrolase